MTETIEPNDTAALDTPRPQQPAYITAALCLGAGAIHLVMAPGHAAESELEALLFALTGWFQVLIAAVLVFRPSRQMLGVAALGNGVALVAWAWSRTRGLPFGSDPWEAEEASRVDLTVAAFEAGVVLSAVISLVDRPARRISPVFAAIAATAVLALTTSVLASPETADHHGGSPTEVAAPATRCDWPLNPASYWREAKLAGTDGTTTAVPAAGAAAGHHGTATASVPPSSTPSTLGPLGGRGSAQLDKLIALAGDGGEGAAGAAVGELANATDDEYDAFLATLAAGGGHASGTTSTASPLSMSHLGPQQWVPMTEQSDCDRVADELATTREVAMQYPTAADAMTAGYVRVAPYVPGIASHWMKFSAVDGTFDIEDPEMLLYDGNEPESRIAGVSYYLLHNSEMPPTQGFTSDNDSYHRHLGLCIGPGGVIGDSNTTDEECASLGGRKSGGGSGWMSHAWVVPGCESPWGVFSGINPLLDRQLGEQSGDNEGGCAASAVRGRYELEPGTPPPANTEPSNQDAEAAATAGS